MILEIVSFLFIGAMAGLAAGLLGIGARDCCGGIFGHYQHLGIITRLGVFWSHRLSTVTLSRVFAVFLCLLAVKLFYGVWFS